MVKYRIKARLINKFFNIVDYEVFLHEYMSNFI